MYSSVSSSEVTRPEAVSDLASWACCRLLLYRKRNFFMVVVARVGFHPIHRHGTRAKCERCNQNPTG